MLGLRWMLLIIFGCFRVRGVVGVVEKSNLVRFVCVGYVYVVGRCLEYSIVESGTWECGLR